MNKKLIPLLTLISILSLAGCGDTTSTSESVRPSDVVDSEPSTSEEITSDIVTGSSESVSSDSESVSSDSETVTSGTESVDSSTSTTSESTESTEEPTEPEGALWPADEVADYMTQMGLDNVTILPPTFNYEVTTYELEFSDGPILAIYANGGVDTLTYKDALVVSGWTVVDSFGNDFYLCDPTKTCEIDLYEGYDNYTEIDILPFIDTTVFPSSQIDTIMDQIGLSGVTIPAIATTSTYEYEVDYYDGDDSFIVYVSGDNFLSSYANTLTTAGWEQHSNSLALTAFDPSDKAEMFIVYSVDDSMATMTIKPKEDGSATWPTQELSKVFTDNQFTITVPECGGFFFQLYLEGLEYDGSIGIFVWTRDHTDYENYETALTADGWQGSDGMYEKDGYSIELIDDIDGDSGSISIFIYPPEAA